VDRQDELGLDDLIFYVYEEGEPSTRVPRDFLLQLHVAVSNVGGRKAVLSKLELTAFLDAQKCSIDIGLVPTKAIQYSTRELRTITLAVLRGQHNNFERFSTSEEFPGPFLLIPDDVITLRLRARGGIDWAERWTLEALESLGSALKREISYARLVATYRRGDEAVTQTFDVRLQVLQQSMYKEALESVTDCYKTRPNFDIRTVTDL
jgi:hypothetical protein